MIAYDEALKVARYVMDNARDASENETILANAVLSLYVNCSKKAEECWPCPKCGAVQPSQCISPETTK